jgi:mannose/cellobiose epimerase-like protein (N-acyl-D-glucosamine 2-epimerase family)
MSAPVKVRAAAARLHRWLLDDALPIWWERAADPAGGYFDRLNLDGTVADTPRRLRVQARLGRAGQAGEPPRPHAGDDAQVR